MIETSPWLPGFESEQRARSLSQFFTPPWLAERLWSWMMAPALPRALRVLEPSAGNGALIRPLRKLAIPVQSLVAYEVDPVHVATLAQLVASDGLPAEIRARDFTADKEPGAFDISSMNPPYEGGQEIAFTERALGCCANVGGVFRAAMLFGQERHEFWRWTDIRRLAFLSERPDFGGEHGALSDFIVLDLQCRKHSRKQGEPTTTNIEWWLRGTAPQAPRPEAA